MAESNVLFSPPDYDSDKAALAEYYLSIFLLEESTEIVDGLAELTQVLRELNRR